MPFSCLQTRFYKREHLTGFSQVSGDRTTSGERCWRNLLRYARWWYLLNLHVSYQQPPQPSALSLHLSDVNEAPTFMILAAISRWLLVGNRLVKAGCSLWGRAEFFQGKAGVSSWQEQNVSVGVIGTRLSDFRKLVAGWPRGTAGRGGSVLAGPQMRQALKERASIPTGILHKADVSDLIFILYIEVFM